MIDERQFSVSLLDVAFRSITRHLKNLVIVLSLRLLQLHLSIT